MELNKDSEQIPCHGKESLFHTSFTVENFAIKHLELLDIEKDAEIEENKLLREFCSPKKLQRQGICIPKLRIGSTSTGLFGRSLLNFEPFWPGDSLPTHTISSGDIVGIGNLNNYGAIEIVTSGVVTRISETVISVVFEKNSNFSDLENDTQYMVIKLANDVTYRRLKRALKYMQSKSQEYHLVDVLFGNKSPSSFEDLNFNDLSFYNNNLNEDQKEAVKFALSQKELAIIHGPPGTGKTTTVVECILQAVVQKLKILACAPSNVAVDNLVEKLSAHKIKMVRLGHPARFLTSIQQYSLDAIVSNYDGSNVVEELHKEIDQLRDRINKTKGSASRRSMWAENRSLLKEVKEREKFIAKQILKNADVILCTLTSGSDDGPMKYVDKDHFNVCFIDECSQAIEAACWIPLLQVRKCVLAGDHHQLPPTIISKQAAREGLELTLMERLLKLHGDGIKRMLTTQYRMNKTIMQWPSEQLYEGKLQAHESVQSHLLNDLPGIESNDDTTIPLLLIDTVGCGLQELQAEDEESKGNEGEADLVAMQVENLIKSGLNPADVAIITPYNLQVELIKSRFSGKYPKLEVKSVDGFQGREKEAIVLSLVRSNDKGEVGFLAEDRRINVAITRAKRHLAVICDSKTVSCHAFLKSFVNYCEEKGEVRTAFQYESEIGHYSSKGVAAKQAEEKKSSTNTRKGDKSSLKKKQGDSTHSSVSESIQRVNNISPVDKRASEEKYEKIIMEFMKSDKTCMMFPHSLNGFERRIIHEIAEQNGLSHISSGLGSSRCIEVKKHTETTDVPPSEERSEHSVFTIKNTFETIGSDHTEDRNEETKSNPIKHPPKVKLKNEPAVRKKQPVKSNLKVLKLKESTDPNGEDDFDALIEQVVKADKTCRFSTCKKSVATLSQVCEFCKGRFCFSHFIPEVHGCGDAAKAQARSQIRKDGVLYAGSGRPEKKVDSIKHSYLQKKMDKKLSELSNKRKTQKKE